MNLHERLQHHLGCSPRTEEALFLAPNATILGDVHLGPRSSVWYGAVVRGDINSIRVGAGTNLQDGVIVHLADDAGVTIGSHVTVGHRAIIHACAIEDECLIGMGATVLDHARVGARSIIGANSLVTRGTVIPPGSLVYGNPAKVVRALSPEEQEGIRYWAEKYIGVARAHRERLRQEPANG